MPKIGLNIEMVLNAAITAADEKGLTYITLKDLASRLNIKTPSLYNYVDGLQGLYNMLAIHGLQSLKSVLGEAAIGLTGREALLSMGKAYFDFAKTHPGLYDATQSVKQWKNEEANQLSGDIIRLVEKVLITLQVEESSMTHIIRMIRSMLHGFASLERKKGFGNPVSIEESFLLAMEILLDGIKAKFDVGMR